MRSSFATTLVLASMAGLSSALSTSDAADLKNANSAISALSGLSQSLVGSSSKATVGLGDSINDAFETVETWDKHFGMIAKILGIPNIFKPSDLSIIMNKLDEISQQIDILSTEINQDFD